MCGCEGYCHCGEGEIRSASNSFNEAYETALYILDDLRKETDPEKLKALEEEYEQTWLEIRDFEACFGTDVNSYMFEQAYDWWYHTGNRMEFTPIFKVAK